MAASSLCHPSVPRGFLLTALLLVLPATGQILRLGYCPSFSVLKDFEMDKVGRLALFFTFILHHVLMFFFLAKYLGTWYQIERYFSFPGLGGKCWTQTYYADQEVPGKFKLRMDYRDFVYV